jgi:hypothetical protein
VAKIFLREETSPLFKALKQAGLDDVSDMSAMYDAHIDSLVYNDGGTTKPVLLGYRSIICIWKTFLAYRTAQGEEILAQDYVLK